jgi:predicted dehydrogenase
MPEQSPTLGVAVVGTGIMGRRMLAALQQQAAFQAVALWDPAPASLQAAQPLAPGARLASSLDDVVHDPAVRLVYIASPPSWHLAGVRAALAAGRACLCEKPLAHSVAEAEALRALVAQAGLPFAVNFPFAASSSACGMRDLVAGGALGELQRASVTLRFAQWPRPWQAGASSWLAGGAEGGFTREVLSHFVFQSLRLFGPAQLESVQLQRTPGASETALRARLRHAQVTVEIDAAVAGEVADQNRFEVVGSRGTVALSQWSRLEWQGQVQERSDGTARVLAALADVLQGRPAAQQLATADEAAAVVACIEGLLQG